MCAAVRGKIFEQIASMSHQKLAHAASSMCKACSGGMHAPWLQLCSVILPPQILTHVDDHFDGLCGMHGHVFQAHWALVWLTKLHRY